jgi:hypothetical protein
VLFLSFQQIEIPMDAIKKMFGLVWCALGLFAGYFSITSIGLPKLTSGMAGNQSDLVFGIIMLFILTPIIVGSLLFFGYYALSGDYKEEADER